jgi:rubrerythrin
MKKKTEDNVKTAFAGESQAHMKYKAFADAAEKEDFANVARHLKTLAGIQKTAQNLQAALDGENYEVEDMYPAFKSVAESEGEKAAVYWFSAALEAEKVHAGLYKKAKEVVDKGQDLAYFPIHVCSVCGFTVEGDAPDKCPVCGAPKEKFIKY